MQVINRAGKGAAKDKKDLEIWSWNSSSKVNKPVPEPQQLPAELQQNLDVSSLLMAQALASAGYQEAQPDATSDQAQYDAAQAAAMQAQMQAQGGEQGGEECQDPAVALAVYQALLLQAQGATVIAAEHQQAIFQETPQFNTAVSEALNLQASQYQMGARYEGTVMKWMEENGRKTWGFISCPEAGFSEGNGLFFQKKDCNYKVAQTGILQVGLRVSFSIHTASDGRLQAKSVMDA